MAPPQRRQVHAAPAAVTAKDKSAQLRYQKQKRMQRREQNLLLSKLDSLLPEEARHGGFKGCGHRSAGISGRSVLNVLTDVVKYVKSARARSASASDRLPTPETSKNTSYRDGSVPPHPALWARVVDAVIPALASC